MRIPPSPADLEALCRRWQARLELTHWHVTIRIGRRWDLESDQGYKAGRVRYVEELRVAEISLRDPVDKPPEIWIDDDYEVYLVHELLHLHMAPFAAEDETPADTAQEQMINALARAFVALARGEPDAEGQVDGPRGDDEQALRGAEATNDRPGGIRLGQHEGGQGADERGQGEEQEALRGRP
jgi:hypothetical protein